MQRLIINYDDLSQMLGIKKKTLQNKVCKGVLPFKPIYLQGLGRVFRWKDVIKWVDAAPEAQVGKKNAKVTNKYH